MQLELAIEDLSAARLAFAIDPAGREPGRVRIDARIGEGSVGLDANVEPRREGPSVVSRLRLVNLPVGSVRPYLAMFGWSALAARLDAELEHRFATGGAHEVAGRAALSDVAVAVPEVSQISLVEPRVVVDPRAVQPVVALAPPGDARAACRSQTGASRHRAMLGSALASPALRPRTVRNLGSDMRSCPSCHLVRLACCRTRNAGRRRWTCSGRGSRGASWRDWPSYSG